MAAHCHDGSTLLKICAVNLLVPNTNDDDDNDDDNNNNDSNVTSRGTRRMELSIITATCTAVTVQFWHIVLIG